MHNIMIPSFVVSTDESGVAFCIKLWFSFAYSTPSSSQMTVKAAPSRRFGRANGPTSAYMIFPVELCMYHETEHQPHMNAGVRGWLCKTRGMHGSQACNSYSK